MVAEEEILKELQGLPLGGQARNQESLKQLINQGLEASEFSQVVQSIAKQLQGYVHLQQEVHAMQSPQDLNSFVMNVSSLLHELECPYNRLVSAPLTERLATPENRLLLLDFLLGELAAARMNYATFGPDKSMQNGVASSPVEDDLRKICSALGLGVPPKNANTASIFSKMETTLQNAMQNIPPQVLGSALLRTQLNPAQWQQLEQINDALSAEYRLRREMLLKRFDVTVQSFTWSEKARNKEKQLSEMYMPRRHEMSMDSKVLVADILSARDDMLLLEKTSSHGVRQFTECNVNKTVMGNVPDRGGRPHESVIGMPGFSERVAGGRGRGGFRGRGGGGGFRGGNRGIGGRGGGGRVQHGYGAGRGHRGGGGRGSGRGRGRRGGGGDDFW